MVLVTTGLPALSRMGVLALTGFVRRVRCWVHVNVAGRETVPFLRERDRIREDAGDEVAMANCAGGCGPSCEACDCNWRGGGGTL